MVIANPKGQREQGINEVRKQLSLSNSATSKTSDNLVSALDGADASGHIRDELDHIMNTIAQGSTIDFNWVEFRQKLGIKEKIAYLVGSMYAHAAEMGMVTGIASAADTTNFNQTALKAKLDEVLNTLEKELLNNQDFTESFIIRHAALNRFEMKLDDKQRTEVTSLSNELKKLATDQGFDTIEATMHFQHESDAQKIMKISEAVAMMAQAGAKIDQKILDRAEKIAEKIKPIRDLDKQYKHMMNMLNLVHRTARKGFPSMITSKQQKKLFALLNDMGVTDPTVYILDSTKVDQTGAPTYLDTELLALKRKDPIRLKGMLQKHNMSEGELESWFNSYFSFSSVERAKTDLDRQKQVTFGHRLKDYEHDVNSWRGIARNRILAVHTPTPPAAPRMAGNPMDFVTDDDFNFVNSYFDKFPDLFYANEEDADEAADGGHYQQMRDIVAAIIRRRVPALAIGNRRRFGSFMRRRTNSNPQFKAWMTRYYNNVTDDAQIIAMIIMSQNEAKGSIFYADQNPFEKKEGKMQRFSKLIGRTEVGRSAVKEAISKPLNTFLRLSEGAVRIGAKVTNKVVSNVGRGVTWAPAQMLGKVNRMMERNTMENGKEKMNLKWYLAPVWAVSRLTEETFKAANKGFNYTNDNGNAMMHNARGKVIDMLQHGFKDKNITDIYQGFTYSVDEASRFAATGVSNAGNADYERRTTNQKRGILAAFYEAASKEEDLQDIMMSSDLANMLNLKERGPYIFDEDGRVAGTDKAEVKQDNSLQGASKKFAAAFQSQIETLMKQAEEQYNNANLALSQANAGSDEKKKVSADIDFTHASEVNADIKDVQGSIVKLSPLLKSPLTTATPPLWRKADFDAVFLEIDNKFNLAPNGIALRLANEIGTSAVGAAAATGLTRDVDQAYNDYITQSSNVETEELTIEALKEELRGRPAPSAARIATIHLDMRAASGRLQIAKRAKARAEHDYQTKKRELSLKKQHLAHVRLMDKWAKDLQKLSDDTDSAINAAIAAGTSVDDAVQHLAEKMGDMTKHMNLLLRPIANAPTSTDKSADVQKILNRSDIDAATKISLIQTLLAA